MPFGRAPKRMSGSAAMSDFACGHWPDASFGKTAARASPPKCGRCGSVGRGHPDGAVAVTVLILGCYALQTLLPQDAILGAYAFAPTNLTPGRWETLITAIFLHGSWAHAMMNAAFALAFSTPLARFFGSKIEGALLFFGFYVLAGVLSNLGYAAVHPHGHALIVGASGAVSGLMGASARLIGGRGRA